MAMADLQRGVVKWFNNAKGFGFIEHETGRDVFVHYSVIEQDGFRTLKDGEEVSYELKEGDKGLHAIKVCRLIPAGETAAGEAGQKDGMSAPNLESGTVPMVSKTSAEMIEIEKEDSNEESHLSGSEVEIGSKTQSSLDH